MRRICCQTTRTPYGRAKTCADVRADTFFALIKGWTFWRLRRRVQGRTILLALGLGLMMVLAPSEGSASARTVAIRAEALSYEHGEGVIKDPKRAVDLYCQAARLGDPEAQFSLGWIYTNGRGVPRDDAFAASLFKMAAKQGHDYARKLLHHLEGVVAKAPECLSDEPTPDVERGSALSVLSQKQKKLFELVRKLAPEYRISPQLALAVIRAESNFNPNARSAKNAQGLMQLIPETSERFNVTKPYDPVQNLRGGLAYLRWLLAYFQGDVSLATAGYNAGERAVERYRGVPPYAETRAYVKRIREVFKNDHHPFDPSITEPSSELGRMKLPAGRAVLARKENAGVGVISTSRLETEVSR